MAFRFNLPNLAMALVPRRGWSSEGGAPAGFRVPEPVRELFSRRSVTAFVRCVEDAHRSGRSGRSHGASALSNRFQPCSHPDVRVVPPKRISSSSLPPSFASGRCTVFSSSLARGGVDRRAVATAVAPILMGEAR